MSEIETKKTLSQHRGNLRIKVDLTPMVDLGFLLITFFILTTAFTKPNITKLVQPKDTMPSTEVHESDVLTLCLMDNHSIDYCEGKVFPTTIYHHTNYAGIRKVIQDKQRSVASYTGKRSNTTLILFPSSKSTYNDFMRIIDEININDISRYFIINHL